MVKKFTGKSGNKNMRRNNSGEEKSNTENRGLNNQELKDSSSQDNNPEDIEKEKEAEDNEPKATEGSDHQTDPAKELNESLLKIAELQDRYMRLSAEFDNYRKRTLREKTELIQAAGSDFIMQILPVMDNLERALNVIDKATDMEGVKKGIELIYSNFKDFFKQQGLKEIDAHA